MIKKMSKFIGRKMYNSIGHLPESRTGSGDHKISKTMADIVAKQVRDKHDIVIVQEKLDGSNVCVVRENDVLIPLTRAGNTHLNQ